MSCFITNSIINKFSFLYSFSLLSDLYTFKLWESAPLNSPISNPPSKCQNNQYFEVCTPPQGDGVMWSHLGGKKLIFSRKFHLILTSLYYTGNSPYVLCKLMHEDPLTLHTWICPWKVFLSIIMLHLNWLQNIPLSNWIIYNKIPPPQENSLWRALKLKSWHFSLFFC